VPADGVPEFGDFHVATTSRRPSFADWIDEYKLGDREYRLRVTDRSPMADKTAEELDLGADRSQEIGMAEGAPFLVIVLIVCVIMVPWLLPL